MNIYYLIAFVSYFAFFLGLSIYFYSKNSSASALMLGNRSLNYWVTALATQASDMSDWLFMAYPGLIYGLGLFNAWVAIGLTIFMFLNWQFIAPKLRVETEKYQAITLASYFERRFTDFSGTIRLMTVFFTLYFITFYIAAELIGLGRLFENTFAINYNVGIAISIILVVINILLGGYNAVAWSDALRGIFLMVMITIVPLVALQHVPSIPHFSLSDVTNALIPDYSAHTFTAILLLAAGWGLGYFGSPHILINFMGIKDSSQIHKAKWVGIGWQIYVLTAATIVGLVGMLFFSSPLPNRELVFIQMVKDLFQPLFAGFILCAILAATMSVMTSQILATAAILSQDFFVRFAKKNNPATALTILRYCIVALPILAYAISYNNSSNINDLISYAWSGLGLSFAPAVIASLYLPQIHRYGIMGAMLFGGIMGMIWPLLGLPFMPLLPGFIICTFLLLIISSRYERA